MAKADGSERTLARLAAKAAGAEFYPGSSLPLKAAVDLRDCTPINLNRQRGDENTLRTAAGIALIITYCDVQPDGTFIRGSGRVPGRLIGHAGKTFAVGPDALLSQLIGGSLDRVSYVSGPLGGPGCENAVFKLDFDACRACMLYHNGPGIFAKPLQKLQEIQNRADEATTTETTPEPSGDAVGTSLNDIDDEKSQSEDAGVVIASSNGLYTEDDALRQEISRLGLAMKQDAARAGMDRTGVYPPRTVPNDLDVEQMLVQKWHAQNGLCALCDKPIPWNPTNKLLQLSRDRADSANKTYDFQNTQLTHLACNLGKSDATADEWRDYLAMVRQPPPR